MCNRVLFFVVLFLLLSFFVSAQSDAEMTNRYPGLKLDLPLFDLPYQISSMDAVGKGFFGSYANPSMAQSLAVSTDIISGFHYGMKMFYDKVSIENNKFKNILYAGGTALIDILFYFLPLYGGQVWLHEEYHRAVLPEFGIRSFNSVYLFDVDALGAYVDIKFSDEVYLKKESVADYIRLYAAGMEGELLWVEQLQRNNFFYNQKLLNEIQYWISISQVVGYVNMANLNNSPADDFYTDYTVWTYALFRPNEPLGERGYYAIDLTKAERDYLKLQGGLQLFNVLSPMMFGIRTIPLGNTGFEGNFAFRHYLTSFGADIPVSVFLKYRHFNMAFTYHSYLNYEYYFPAIEAELVDYPFSIGKLNMYLSPRVLIGMQPKNQEFKVASPDFLGLFGLRVDFNLSKHILPYIDFTAKTRGWVAGNEYLTANASVRLGVSARF